MIAWVSVYDEDQIWRHFHDSPTVEPSPAGVTLFLQLQAP
jgi:hypothetical protein